MQNAGPSDFDHICLARARTLDFIDPTLDGHNLASPGLLKIILVQSFLRVPQGQ